MFRLSEKLKILEDKINGFLTEQKDKLSRIILLCTAILYFYGMAVRLIGVGALNFRNAINEKWFTLNPFKNIGAIFTPYGIIITLFIILMYCLFTKKGYRLLSGYKTVRDKERGIEILPEGTHGTSGWMNKNELSEILEKGDLNFLDETLFGKLDTGEYVALKDMRGMNKNVIIYGSPGTGKSRGFFMPFALQAVKRNESLITVDPKAEFYEMYSEFLREQGYTVKAYNLLDLCASDGWNCVAEAANDLNLVQNVAEIIINNTSSESDRDDFWAKAEKNLLMALLHYVGSMKRPGTDKLLPIEERSLGTIYKILSTTSVQELDAKFKNLPADHPALPPYGIFRQAHKQIWGNIIIGLGNRLNVFQNKAVDNITKHHEIDLTLDGNMYRSIPTDPSKRRRVLNQLSQQFDLSGIPGFYTKNNKWQMANCRYSGILIPVCDINNQIQGLQIRFDDPPPKLIENPDGTKSEKKGERFRWFSTGGEYYENGTGISSYIHVVGDINCDTVHLTEGPMKADIASFLAEGELFIGLTGVQNVRYLAEVVKKLHPKRIVECIDMDVRTNPHVQRAQSKIRSICMPLCEDYRTFTWPIEQKGIDDWLLFEKLKREHGLIP